MLSRSQQRLFKFKLKKYASSLVSVHINNQPVSVPQNTTIIQACEQAGVAIPRFCYDERLSIAGNCRMCLVEVEKTPKPVASCAMPVMPGMKIHTDTPMVKKAREGVMEFLLANHPLDCPICDQGGECDLQDQAVRYGNDRSRFVFSKRAVEDKDLGPLVKTEMTRCIQCTRCVRFANEVAGAPELGTTGRGSDMQIGTYVEQVLKTELSGNVIDLCPVGALTSKPYAFKARPWELKNTETFDVMDALGGAIRVDSRGMEVLRVLPRNEEWISDKTRFAVDGLHRQRLATPLVHKEGKFVPVGWPEALELIVQKISNVDKERIAAVVGGLADAESLSTLKDWFNGMDCENLHVEGNANYGVDLRSYLCQTENIDEADSLLLVGCHPRLEAAVFASRIRQAAIHHRLPVSVVGPPANLPFPYKHLGDDSSAFDSIKIEGERPMVIVGAHVSTDTLGSVSSLVRKFPNLTRNDWQGVNILHHKANSVAAADLGYSGNLSQSAKFVYLLNADETSVPEDAFVVYQGHHGDAGAHCADVILPGAAYTEKRATFIDTTGRPLTTTPAVGLPGAAREDWRILRALAEVCNVTLPYSNEYELHQRMTQLSPTFSSHNRTLGLGELAIQHWKCDKPHKVTYALSDYFQTNVICRASKTMGQCSAIRMPV